MTPVAAALESFFDRARDAFARAAACAGGTVERSIRVGGRTARLSFAGKAFVGPVMPAVTHLETAGGGESLTIAIWDARSTGVVLAPPPWEALACFERANLRGYQDGRFLLILDRATGVFSAVDGERDLAVYWAADAALVPYFERAAPLRHVLQGWLRRDGLFVAHASAVGVPSGGVMLAGKSASGKSSTAVLCLGSPLQYAGDDFVLVGAGDEPWVHSLYASAKLTATTLPWLSELSPDVTNGDRLDVEKALIFLAPSHQAHLVPGFPLRAILLPRVTGRRDTTVERVAPGAAFRTMVPDTLFRSPESAQLAAAGLQRLVHRLPCYALGLGTDLTQIPRRIVDVLTACPTQTTPSPAPDRPRRG